MRGSWIVTDETDECLLRPSPPVAETTWGSQSSLEAPRVLEGTGFVSELVEDLRSDESMLSFVLALVVDPSVSLAT